VVTRSAKRLAGTEIRNAKGKRVGEIDHVLFHPTENRAIGFEIERRPLLLLIRRKPVFAAFDGAVFSGSRGTVSESADFGSRAARRLGVDWHESVIWIGMPVRTTDGTGLGRAKDVRLGDNGEVISLELTGGTTADIALGVREIPADALRGFDGECLRVEAPAAAVEFDGGAAATAGRGTAVAAHVAEQTAKTAVAYGKAAAKVASESETGKKTVAWLRAAKDKTLDAMAADDED
jgi:uncharacterized protein YrrD